MTDEVARLRESVERLLKVGGREGIEPDGPIAIWLAAQAETLEALISVVESQTDRIDGLVRKAGDAVDLYAPLIKGRLEEASQALEAGKLALAQAKNAQLYLHTSQETLVVRMIQETLPLFAQRMQEVLVIREKAWSQNQAWRRYVTAGVIAIGVFLVGLGVGAWTNGAASLGTRCMSHLATFNGHVVCDLGTDTKP